SRRGAKRPALDAVAIASVLNRHGVRYVVIGAFAAIAQQAPIEPTTDIDLTPDPSPTNLRRLSAALREPGARIRSDASPEGLPFVELPVGAARPPASLKPLVSCGFGFPSTSGGCPCESAMLRRTSVVPSRACPPARRG